MHVNVYSTYIPTITVYETPVEQLLSQSTHILPGKLCEQKAWYRIAITPQNVVLQESVCVVVTDSLRNTHTLILLRS